MGVAVAEHAPTGFGAVVAVVDDADTAVDVLADGVGIGSRGAAYILVVTIDIGVVVIEQVVSDIVDMLIIVFVEMATGSGCGGDALSHRKPCGGSI